jgi:hypothetical protein
MKLNNIEAQEEIRLRQANPNEFERWRALIGSRLAHWPNIDPNGRLR